MTVLVTRAHEDGAEIVSEIESLGIDVFSEPIIEFIIFLPNNEIDYSKYEAFIFTSKNAVKYLKKCDHSDLLDKQCFAIGDTTADMLRDLGFSNVLSANNNINKLIKDVESFGVKKVFYFRGQEISTDLKSVFSSYNIVCDEHLCYGVKTAVSLSEELVRKITAGEIKIVLFFSKNTAESFLSLCNQYEIAKFMKKATILTVSRNLMNVLKGSIGNSVESFEGSRDSMLELIKLYYV